MVSLVQTKPDDEHQGQQVNLPEGKRIILW